MFTFPTLNRTSPQANGLRYCWPMFGYPPNQSKELGRGAHATLTTTTTVAGPQSPILTPLYNGTTHYGSAAIDLGDVNTLTVSLWLYWDTNATGFDIALEYTVMADSAGGGGGNGWWLIPDWSPAGWMIGNGYSDGAALAQLTTRPSAAAWHHFVVLLDRTLTSGVAAAYVDGLSAALTVTPTALLTGNFKANASLYFMSRATTSLFGAGRLCDVRLYAGKLLTQAEAWALYDPRTRWDLYLPSDQLRAWQVLAQAVPVVSRRGLMGVGR